MAGFSRLVADCGFGLRIDGLVADAVVFAGDDEQFAPGGSGGEQLVRLGFGDRSDGVCGPQALVCAAWLIFRGTSLFAWSAFAFLSLYIFGDQWFGFQVAGDSHRLLPEWDLFAVLCGVMLATQGWKLRPKILHAAVALLVIAMFCSELELYVACLHGISTG